MWTGSRCGADVDLVALPPPLPADPLPPARVDVWGVRPDRQWYYAVLLALLVGSIAVPRAWVTDGPVVCPTRLLFSVPCPGCGLTRAASAMGHLDLAGAWSEHPFAAMSWAAALAILVGRGLQAVFGWQRSLFPRGVLNSGPALVFFCAWLVWGVWRLLAACLG